VVAALAGYRSGALPIFRGVLQDYFGITIQGLGLLYSVGLVPGAVAALAVGILITRKGALWAVRVCVAGVGIGMCLAAIGTRWGIMLAALAVLGCFGHALYVSMQAYLTSLFPNRRRRVISLALVAVSSANILYRLLAKFLLDLQSEVDGVSFANVLHIPFAVLAILMFVGIFLYRKAARPPQAPDSQPGVRLSLKWLSGGTMMLVGITILHGASDTALAMWMPRVLDSASFPVKAVDPAFVMVGFGLAYAVSRAGLSILPEKTGRRMMLVAPGILGGAVLLAGILSRSQILTAAGYVAAGFLWSFEYPAALALISEREPHRYGTFLAISMLGTSTSAFVVANLMGWMAGKLGESGMWAILIVPACGFPLAGITGALWLARNARSGETPPAGATN